MKFTLIKNPDESNIVLYKISRIVYAETKASSLYAVEALSSMISNLCIKSQRNILEIINDKNIFDSLNDDSLRHENLFVDVNNNKFHMCLRTVRRMMGGQLQDCCSGATRFHHADNIPNWALSIGYISEIDDLLFYL